MKLLCRQPPCRLAPAPSHPVSSPGVEPGLRPSHGSRANPAHSEDMFLFSAPPRNRTPSGSFEDCHAIRHTRRALSSVSTRNRTWIWTFGGSYAIRCTIETFSVPTWSRTRARALGEPRAIRYTIGTNKPEPTTGFAPASCGLQDRRLAVRPRRLFKQECEESNPVRRVGDPPALPGARSCIGPRSCVGPVCRTGLRHAADRSPARQAGPTPAASRSSTLR